jgi:hypothetical protein
MSTLAMQLHKAIDELNEMQLEAIFKVVSCFITQKDFDYISPEDSERINHAFDEIRHGDCVSFATAEEMATYFGVSD